MKGILASRMKRAKNQPANRVRHFIGMNKGSHHSSVCHISEDGTEPSIEIFLRERHSRKKYDGGHLLDILRNQGLASLPKEHVLIGENAYGDAPVFYEEYFQKRFPYFEWMVKNGLEAFSSRFNSEMHFVPHHRCHAMAAVEMSPFQNSLILVVDGCGSSPNAFAANDEEFQSFPTAVPVGADMRECVSAYLQNGKNLRCVYKSWQTLELDSRCSLLSESLGIFYQSGAKFVFNNRQEAGKLMGLAPFGRPTGKIVDRAQCVREWDWKKAFRSKGKKAWEKSPHRRLYEDLAATVQEHFEMELRQLLVRLKREFSDQTNLILTGGCALNCVANQKVLDEKIFDRVYVPPFPGDESIGVGVAAHLRYIVNGQTWRPRLTDSQFPNFGSRTSVPSSIQIENTFKGYSMHRSRNISDLAAKKLYEGNILGWFQGRSESGPRSLGYRSLLASPLRPGIRNLLNDRVKGRESFRPYAGSCLQEKIADYFEVEDDFESPFMSFAPALRPSYRKTLGEMAHIDGTSRVQTVTQKQNPRFYDLIRAFGEKSGIFCVLNTSLNVMGEPIVETLEDAKRFFDTTPVHGMIIQDFLIQK